MKTLFKKYLKYVWPIQKRFLSLPKRCSACLEVLEKENICEECLKTELVKNNETKFISYINDIISDNGEMYDFAFMLSGGKDSCYCLDKFSYIFPKAKILCIFIDNGLYEDIVYENIFKIIDKTGFDLIINSNHKKRFKKNLSNEFKNYLSNKQEYNSIDYADGSLIFQIGEEIAINNGINNILCGMTKAQADRICDTSEFYIESEYCKIIFPLVGFDYSQIEANNVYKKYGIEDSVVSTNNKILPALCAIDIKRNGYLSFEKELSYGIRLGHIKRSDYLDMIECLTWLTKKGFLDNEIKKAIALLDEQ